MSSLHFEIQQLWQSGFSRAYSNFCCSCSFKPEIIKSGQSSHKMYSNNIVNFQVSTIILNSCKKSLETYWIHLLRNIYFGCLFHDISTFMLFWMSRALLSDEYLFEVIFVLSWLVSWNCINACKNCDVGIKWPCSVSLGCRIHRLHLCRGVRPNLTSVLDMTESNVMVRFHWCHRSRDPEW